MKLEYQERIVEAIDYAVDKFKEDEEAIFASEIERQILKYEKVFRKWNTSQNCIFHNCENKSIKKSHTIQKMASLRRISENGKVMTPQFNHNKEKLEVVSIGFGAASTFPGFCQKHERLFEDFELNKEINNSKDVVLQIFRTVCREKFSSKYNIDSLEARKKQYIQFRNKKVEEIFRQKIGNDFLEGDISFEDFRFDYNDVRLNLLNKNIKKLRLDKRFIDKFYNCLIYDLDRKSPKKTYTQVIIVDIEFPVTLAGRSNFAVKTKNQEIDIILNILPYESKTYIVVSTFIKNKRFVEQIIDLDRLNNPIEIFNMLESWMIYGSDHWFLTPSVWNQIKSEYQEKIISEIWNLTKDITHECEYSIFNSYRREFVRLIEEKIKDDNIPDAKEYLKKERAKLTN